MSEPTAPSEEEAPEATPSAPDEAHDRKAALLREIANKSLTGFAKVVDAYDNKDYLKCLTVMAQMADLIDKTAQLIAQDWVEQEGSVVAVLLKMTVR